MTTTDNGYSAPPKEGVRALVIDGAAFAPGVKDWDPVWDVFNYFWTEFDNRVEWLRPGWCWGYSFRPNANNPNALSRHSGGIATDGNAPLHPNGIPAARTFTSSQIETIHVILDEVRCTDHDHRVLRWGGDYNGTPDAMHVEIDAAPQCVANAAANLNGGLNMDEATLTRILREQLQPVKEAGVRQTQRIMSLLRDSAERDVNQARMLRALVRDMRAENATVVAEEADRLEARAKSTIKELDDMGSQPEH